MPGSPLDMYVVSVVVAGWLLTYALHSTLLLGLAWLITRRSGFLSFRLKENLWKTVLLGGLITATVQTAGGIAPLAGRVDLFQVHPQRLMILKRTTAPVGIISAQADLHGTVQSSEPLILAWNGARSPWPYVIVAGWAVGMAVGFARLVVMKRRLGSQLKRCPRHPLTRGPLVLIFKRLCRQARIQQRIRLTSSPSILNPCALGSGEICLPSRAVTHLSAEQQESMLAHELAHLVRADSRWSLLLAILQVVFFFQPLNTLACRRLQETAEYLCDEWAIQSTGRSLSLAQCIAEVATWIHEQSAVAYGSGLMGSQSILVSRVTYLLAERHATRKSRVERWSFLWLCGVLLACIWLTPNVSVARNPKPVFERTTEDRMYVVLPPGAILPPPDIFEQPVSTVTVIPTNP